MRLVLLLILGFFGSPLLAAADAPPVATQWLILIAALLVAGLFYAVVIALGIAFLASISYYVTLIGVVGIMLLLSNAVVSDLLAQLGPGSNLWWITGPIATAGVFVPIYKTFRRHVLDEPVSRWETVRYYAPIAFIVITFPFVLYSIFQSSMNTVVVDGVEYCTNCDFGIFRWLFMIVASVFMTAAILGFVFVFLYGGVTAVLGSVALLLHSVANGHPIDLMMFFDTLVGVFDEFISVHLPGVAALIWSFLSTAYTVFQHLRE
ncbi:MAG: hypothetical protein QNJ05_14795 [Woeseiaceae bacterium]|nr:hypothetical protein [Woeseiaceae bacterium]